MDGALADMCFTDPPYNVAYQGNFAKLGSASTIANDSMTEDTFKAFLTDAFANMAQAVKRGGSVYVCHSDTHIPTFYDALQANGILFKQTIVWVKNQPVKGGKTMKRLVIVGREVLERKQKGWFQINYDYHWGYGKNAGKLEDSLNSNPRLKIAYKTILDTRSEKEAEAFFAKYKTKNGERFRLDNEASKMNLAYCFWQYQLKKGE